jgi:hypothetical protein
MILRGPVHDFEVELLASIVLVVAEANTGCYIFDPMGSWRFLI